MNRLLLLVATLSLTGCRLGLPDLMWPSDDGPAAPKAYHVAYDLRGPGTPPASTPVTLGTVWTVSEVVPTLEGSFFAGWLGSDGARYAPGQAATFSGAADLTLSALWTSYQARTAPWTSVALLGSVAYGWNPAVNEVQSLDLSLASSALQTVLAIPNPQSVPEVATDGTNVWAVETAEYTRLVRLVHGTVANFTASGTAVELPTETAASGFAVVQGTAPTFWMVGQSSQTIWRIDADAAGSLTAIQGSRISSVSRSGSWGADWSAARNQLLVAATSVGEVWGLDSLESRAEIWASGLGPVQDVSPEGDHGLAVASDSEGTRVWSLGEPGGTPVLEAAWTTGSDQTRIAVSNGTRWMLQKGTLYGYVPAVN